MRYFPLTALVAGKILPMPAGSPIEPTGDVRRVSPYNVSSTVLPLSCGTVYYMSFWGVLCTVSKAVAQDEPRKPGMKTIGAAEGCLHPKESLELLSTNGLTYYYSCDDCGGLILLWRR